MPHAFDGNGCWVPIETHDDVANVREQFLRRETARKNRMRRHGTTALFLMVIVALLAWGCVIAAADLGFMR